MTSNHIYDVVISNHNKLFETIKEATEYCDHHKIPRATIRQYEHREEYDEDGFLEEIWNFDDWTYPLKNKKKKVKLVIEEEEEEFCYDHEQKMWGKCKIDGKMTWLKCGGCLEEEEEEEEKKTICSACKRDFTDEVDDRSSFDEIGKIICKDCFEEEEEKSKFLYPERCRKFWNVELQKHEWRQYLGAGQFCEPEKKQYYKVCRAENPDVEYFDTLHEAKAFCDKHADLDYGLIMLCDFEKNEIGDWGDYDEEEVDISCIESELDNMLYQENMDWSFDKPTKGKYETIYIIKREEEENYDGVIFGDE